MRPSVAFTASNPPRTRDYITILQWIWDDRRMSEHPAAGPEALGLIAERYAVEAVLGRGGMGKVYRVRDTRTGRRLALKRGWTRDSRKAVKRRALLEREFHTL